MTRCEFYSYVSTKTGADPVKTVFVCVPDENARSLVDVEAFVRRSGWVEQVERDASVLVAPVVPKGWESEPDDCLMDLYCQTKASFVAPSGESISGRFGKLWAWEVFVYVVGYGEGAVFAADALVAHPGFAAATILVDGGAHSLVSSELPSEHWFVGDPNDYSLRNRDVPVAVWLMGEGGDVDAFRAYLCEVNGALEPEMSDGDLCLGTRAWVNRENPACCVIETPGLTGLDPRIAELGMGEFFNRILRWKNAPDGTLALHVTREEFFKDGRYRHGIVQSDKNDYHYAVYLPEGMKPVDARGLPLVISLHGRGEPTWIFSQKNGWEDLADETRAFAVLLPDSPHNVWLMGRDANALKLIVESVMMDYDFDEGRVYLTGFSNGALFTYQLGTTFPELFAAASPWNSPGETALSGLGDDEYAYCPSFETGGVELPFWISYGDSDDKAPVAEERELVPLLKGNGCSAGCFESLEAESSYPVDKGYVEGDRLDTRLYLNAEGRARVGVTVVKNMPHGAIADEARAAWEFMSRFRRSAESLEVEES